MPNTAIIFPTDGRSGVPTAFRVFRADGQVYRAASGGFVAYQQSQADAGDYDQAAAEQGTSGRYVGTMPAGIAAGDYQFEAWQGGQLVGVQEWLHWDGGAFVYLAQVPAATSVNDSETIVEEGEVIGP